MVDGVIMNKLFFVHYVNMNVSSKEYWNSILDERKTNAIIIISKIQKSYNFERFQRW
jgi:hypothetical protein